jgi:hypothetical protein
MDISNANDTYQNDRTTINQQAQTINANNASLAEKDLLIAEKDRVIAEENKIIANLNASDKYTNNYLNETIAKSDELIAYQKYLANKIQTVERQSTVNSANSAVFEDLYKSLVTEIQLAGHTHHYVDLTPEVREKRILATRESFAANDPVAYTPDWTFSYLTSPDKELPL